MDLCDNGMLVCPVPTSCGNLISLKHVYRSWKNERISHILDGQPLQLLFRKPGTRSGGEIFKLAEPAMISLVNLMFADIGIPNDIPFKIEFKCHPLLTPGGEDDDEWESFTFVDQIKIASIVFQLTHENGIKQDAVENRVMNNNRLLVSLKIVDDGKVAVEIRDTTKVPMEFVPHKISVFDAEFNSLMQSTL